MQGRRVLVTGANSGIGLVTARRLAGLGAEIVLVCRDAGRGAAALDEVATLAVGPKPVLHVCDLSSQIAIRALVDALRGEFERLDVLVNNAGAVFGRRERTVDGIERTFATNHLAPFLLTLLLLPMLRRSPSARIVTVASRVHAGSLDLTDLHSERGYSAMKQYARSKLANILFTYELARRLGSGTVTANCLAPGLVGSNFGRNAGGLIALIPRLLALTPIPVTPEVGARTSVYLSSSAEVEGMTGGYYYRCRPARSKLVSYDTALAAELWAISTRLTHVAPDMEPTSAAH